MSDDGFEAWRVWSGLERADLDVPHRLLGLEAGERDPLTIVKAADRRATEVRAGIPTDRGGDRDALLAIVEAARDAMLAAAAASAAAPPVTAPRVPPPVPSVAVAPPPVPPPVPPAVPPAEEAVEHAEADGTDGMAPQVRIDRRASRRRSEGNPASLALSALLVAVVAVVAVASWPHLRRGLEPPRVREVATRSDARPAAVIRQPLRPREPDSGPGPGPEPRPEPATEARPERKTEPMRQPTPDPRPEPPREPARMTEPAPAPPPMETPAAAPTEPPPPAVDVEQVRARVGAAITKAFAAIRDGDFGAATRELAAVADAALDDQQATDRLQRWRQLAHYAGAFPEYRDKALASAASTAATFDLGGRQIGVVEITPREFIYRDSRRPGMNQRASRDAIPPDIELGLVERWFAADGRAANHLFLGAAAFSRREPDLARARREWETAAAGGEPDGRLLLQILDDPAVRGR